MSDTTSSTGRGDQAARFARDVSAPLTESERLQLGVDLLVELVPGADHVGVTIITLHQGAVTEAATSDLVWRGDQLQYELNEGPCLDAVATHGTVISNDLAEDRRWPRWSPAVREELGVQAMMSLLLYTDERELGALNIYAEQRGVFTAEDLALAETLAAHLALAMADSREIEQRGSAMATRTIIGQAEGILMERYKIDADRAFGVLRRHSQDSNRKLVAIATELVRTRELPPTPVRER